MSRWKTLTDKSLDPVVVKKKALPRLVSSQAEADSVESTGALVNTSVTSVSSFYSILMIVAGYSLSLLWGAINSQQDVIQIPMIKNLLFPGNTMIFYDYII